MITFVVVCPLCGAVLDRIPVEDGDWREAIAFGKLAAWRHRKDQHGE